MKRPSRLILVAGFVVVALVCARLGIWQVHRLRERRATNATLLRARSEAPIDLLAYRSDSANAGRTVKARGHYDHADDVVVRGREVGGVPGVEIVSPLIIDHKNAAVLVDRGFVPAPDAVSVVSDSFREPGEREVQGYLSPVASGRGIPLTHGGRTTWARLDLAALQDRIPYRLYPFAIVQSPDSSLPRFPRRQPPPDLDDGPHLYYAIQWFSFSIIALVFAGTMARQTPPATMPAADHRAAR
jgi:surfeit locus 1 family protein